MECECLFDLVNEIAAVSFDYLLIDIIKFKVNYSEMEGRKGNPPLAYDFQTSNAHLMPNHPEDASFRDETRVK